MTNWPDWLPIREDLSSLSPYGAPQIQDVTAMNTNENPFELPEEVVSAILAHLPKVLRNLNRYPDRDAIDLRKELVSYIYEKHKTKFEIENIWAANGSNEILQTLVLACGNRGVLGFTPSYSMHPLITKICGANWIDGKRKPDFTLDCKMAVSQILETKPSIVFITTPNNPTGNSLKKSELEQLAEAAQTVKGLLVIDEAYIEFSDEESSVDLIPKYKNLVVVRTMSKAFALAGARVGYLIANPKVVEMALIARLPYHLSSQTQAIATIALKHHKILQAEIDLLVSERERVVSALIDLGFTTIPSDSNFILFSGFKGSSQEVWKNLLDHKILIRDVGIPNFLRLTIGKPEENDQFLAAITSHRP